MVERFWNKVKQYRRVANRYDKSATNYLAFVHLAAVFVVLRHPRTVHTP
ncbi:transposase [Gemmata massiliana]